MGDRETLNKIFAIMRNLLIVPMDGLNPAPRKGTTKRECYRALWEIQELLGVRRIGCKHIAQTNADRIRAMSDEELAEWVSYVSKGCDFIRCPAGHSVSCAKGCKLVWLDWLQSPVGGAE